MEIQMFGKSANISLIYLGYPKSLFIKFQTFLYFAFNVYRQVKDAYLMSKIYLNTMLSVNVDILRHMFVQTFLCVYVQGTCFSSLAQTHKNTLYTSQQNSTADQFSISNRKTINLNPCDIYRSVHILWRATPYWTINRNSFLHCRGLQNDRSACISVVGFVTQLTRLVKLRADGAATANITFLERESTGDL